MLACSDLLFPPDIAYGASGGPAFLTHIVTLQNGHEQRNIQWMQSRARYNVAYGVKTEAQLSKLLNFFRLHKGKAISFRFRDMLDYRMIQQKIGVGDGQTRHFQLVKTYQIETFTEERIVQKPVLDSILLILKQAEGYMEVPKELYSVDALGVVHFVKAPTAKVEVFASCNFDVPVRFDTDQLSASLDSYGTYSWQDIPLVEVRL